MPELFRVSQGDEDVWELCLPTLEKARSTAKSWSEEDGVPAHISRAEIDIPETATTWKALEAVGRFLNTEPEWEYMETWTGGRVASNT